MEYDVFISHAQKDKSIADAICGKLESAGLKCWTAAREISVREGWTEATRKAIESSRVIVLVLSENANAAPHIRREIAHASYMRRIIITFRLAKTLPRREILFYLSKVPWFNSLNPPTEEHLEALTARIKGLMIGSAGAGNATPPQSQKRKTASLSVANSRFGALRASHYRTLGMLKWVAITTFFCAAVLFSWFALRQTRQRGALAESSRRSVDRGFSLSPTPSPQAGGDALEPKQSSTFTRFGLWQSANGSPTPLVQGSPDASLNTPAEQSAEVASSPQRDVTSEKRAGRLTSEPRPRHLPPVTHRVAADHHQQYPGTQVKQARKIADLENQRDSFRSLLKETEEKVLAIQKNADLMTSERDELQTRLTESEEKTQIAQKNADIMARQLDELRDQLKEAETRALTAQKNEELVRTQRDGLQARQQETEAEAQAAQKNADLATRQRDALQREIGEVRERAQLAETNANLAASQRDAMAAELKKKEKEEAPEKKAQLNQHGSDLAKLADNGPDTQVPEVRRDAQPAHEGAELAQTQPPNPGQHANPAPLTQTLDSSFQRIGPSEH
jgi:TIR domain-containing protein